MNASEETKSSNEGEARSHSSITMENTTHTLSDVRNNNERASFRSINGCCDREKQYIILPNASLAMDPSVLYFRYVKRTDSFFFSSCPGDGRRIRRSRSDQKGASG